MKKKAEALVARGAAHFNAGRPREALAEFRAAFRLGFDRADARCFAAHAHLAVGEVPEAIAAFEASIRLHPGHLPAYLDLAGLLHRGGRLLDAARTLRAALKREPGHEAARLLLAEIETGGGSGTKAFVELAVPGGPLRVPRLGNLPIEAIALLAGVKPVIHCWASEADLPAFDELCRRLRLKQLVIPGERLGVLIGRDAAALKRTARLWGGEYLNPGRSLGYPACCTRWYYSHVVDKKDDDLVRSILRHTRGKKALPFALNDLFYFYSRVPSVQSGARRQKLFARNPGLDLDLLNLIPWHPCSYRCAASLAKAARIWRTARTAAPELADALRACLGRPVVYWDWSRFAVLAREKSGAEGVAFSAVEPPFSLIEPRLLAKLRSADRVVSAPAGLELWKGPRRLGLLGGSPAPILLDFTA
ncbi:MAG: tetratricopeptide repeat protein [Elusimicrobia bacterium]|nr:tetratricopeptide repeat protein [Elusimicrobiota bacterium]